MSESEKAYINNFSNANEELSRTETKVIPKVCSDYKLSRPELDIFEDVYSKDEIRIDKKKVMEAKRKHKEATERSAFLEAVLAKHLEKSEWIGAGVVVSSASKYDDFFNGVDMVVEFDIFEKGEDSLKLSLDVTTGQTAAACYDKIAGIKNKITKEGELSSLKYFVSSESTENSYKGKVEMVPKVIVGTDIEGVKDIAKYIEKLLESKSGSNREMAKHNLQIEIIEEIIAQLKEYIRFAREAGFEESDEIITNQKKVLKKVEEIYEEKKRSVGDNPVGARKEKNRIYKALTDFSR